MSMDEIYCLQAKRTSAELLGYERHERMFRNALLKVIRACGCNRAGADIRFLQMIGNPRPLPSSPDYDPEEHYKTAEEESDERALHDDDLYKERREEGGMESNGVL